MLLATACRTPGAGVTGHLERAEVSLAQLIDLATRERPSSLPTLLEIQRALEMAHAAISVGEVVGMRDSLALIDALIATHPGTDLELGLIALRSLISALQ